MMAFELGWSGQSDTTRFQGLSGGKTSRAETMASASAVSNMMGLSILGILAARMRARRAGSPLTLLLAGLAGGAAGAAPTGNGVTVRSTSSAPTLPLIL